jgi:hypothetical protein
MVFQSISSTFKSIAMACPWHFKVKKWYFNVQQRYFMVFHNISMYIHALHQYFHDSIATFPHPSY